MSRFALSVGIMAIVSLGAWGFLQYRFAENLRDRVEALQDNAEVLEWRLRAMAEVERQKDRALAQVTALNRQLAAENQTYQGIRDAISGIETGGGVDPAIALALERLRCLRDPECGGAGADAPHNRPGVP